MDNVANWILTAVFGALGIWLLMEYVKTNKKIRIADRRWTVSRVLFAIAGLMALVSVVLYNSIMDYIRLAVMAFCIIIFLMMHDGVGDEGIVAYGHFTPWNDLKAYDFKSGKKKFEVFFTAIDRGSKKGEEYSIQVAFANQQEEEVKALLKKHIGKKYRRMKIDG